jgi:hypothetical protein
MLDDTIKKWNTRQALLIIHGGGNSDKALEKLEAPRTESPIFADM